MEDKCKWCGAKAVKIVEWKDGHSYDFSCGSEQTPHGFVRTDTCYEAELHALQELLGEARNKLEKVNDNVRTTDLLLAGFQLNEIDALLARIEETGKG